MWSFSVAPQLASLPLWLNCQIFKVSAHPDKSSYLTILYSITLKITITFQNALKITMGFPHQNTPINRRNYNYEYAKLEIGISKCY